MTTILTKYPFVGSIDTRQGGRIENQDNAGYVDTPLGLLIVVCDGMGGGPGGRTASLMAVDEVLTVLSDVAEHTHREDALRFVIEKANDIIYSKAKETPELRGMGTTIAAVLINESSAIIAHAGDTRVYQLRKGTVVFRTSDHSVVANLVRQKKLTEEEARNHPQSNIITRALGIRPTVEIEFDEVSFIRGDRFVICTDGVWGMMPQCDLISSLSRMMGIEELTSLVTEEIDIMGQEKGGGHDNLTLALIDTSFDSELKDNKKKSVEKNKKNIGAKCFGFSDNWKVWGALVTCVIIIIFFLLYWILSQNKEKTDYIEDFDQHELNNIENKKPQVVSQPNDENVVTEPNPSLRQNSTLQRSPENFFQDSIVINHQKGIARQIDHVVHNLDRLKKIEGKDRGDAQKKKRLFIDNNIKPGINRLRNEVVSNKKKCVTQILSLLDNSKTVQSTRNGRPTKEGNEHIELLKIKVKKLQN